MNIFYEKIPEHYTGEYPSVIIRYREQDKYEAVKIGAQLGGFEINSPSQHLNAADAKKRHIESNCQACGGPNCDGDC